MNIKDLMTIGDIIEKRARELGDKICVSFENKMDISYRELDDITSRVANAMRSFGVSKGDKVAVLMPNSLEILYTWFGLAKIGGIMVPINLANKGLFLRYVLNNSESKLLVLDQRLQDRVKFIEEDLKNLEKVVLWRPEGAVEGSPVELRFETISFEKVYTYSADKPQIEVKPRDPASIIYTSGTTGPSKGVVSPHAQIFLGGSEYNEVTRATSEDVFFTCLPLFHANASWLCVFPAILAGAKAVIYERFSASNFWDQIRRSKATIFNSLGAMAQFIYNQPRMDDDADNPMRCCMAAPMPKDIFEDFEKRYDLKVVEGYGLTETCMPLYNPYERTQPGSCGVPTRSFEVFIVDENDCEVTRGEVGEIIVRCKVPYGMSLGYYKMPEKTVEIWRNFFFHTGDAGIMNEDGYVYFRDRVKDYIRRRGENISSFEVENVVNLHPKVLESAAVGIKSELSEDEVKIFVVLHEGQALLPEKLLAFCEERMPHFAVPRYVEFVDSLPKTPNEKVRKIELRDRGITPSTWDREKVGYKVKR